MLVQSSVFTIHSNEDPLEACGVKGVVCSTTIPMGERDTLRATLNNLGVNREQLYPDLEDLAI